MCVLALALPVPAAAPPAAEQWVVVVAADYEKAIAPLVQHRRSQGWRVAVVRVREHLTANDLLRHNAAPLRDRVHQLCREHRGASSVLLVGAATGFGTTTVPALRGTAGRMRGQPSDAGYGCPGGGRLPTVAVGRFPARSAAEVRVMIDKTIALERDGRPGTWRRRITVLAGIPAYNPVVDRLVERVAFARFDRMAPTWTGRAVYTADGSRFCPPTGDLRPQTLALLREGQAFALYLGHSSAEGLYAGGGAAFLDRNDWGRLRMGHGGVFVTFGCNGCQLSGFDGEGYGLAAVRNPRGPAGVLGSHGVCFAAMVQLACDGLFRHAFQGRPARRLGDCWLAALDGVAHGSIDFFSYRMLDAVDGDPRIPQAAQRQEHLEMFTLLGDPALRLPQVQADMTVDPPGPVAPGQALVVRGRLPARLRGAEVEVGLWRGPATVPIDLQAVPAKPGAERDRVLAANFRRANRFDLATATGRADGDCFEVRLAVPGRLSAGRLSLRVRAQRGKEEALAVQYVEVIRSAR